MVYNKYIGIIGGTGTIGSIIVKYLLQLQTHFHVLIGGRRSIKEISMSTFYNSERLKYNQMNYNNDVELDNFCSQCLLVINAVGPSFKSKRLLNYILCIRFFIEVHSIVSASRFFHMPTYLRVVIECQSRFFPFFPAFSRNCPDYFLHTSGSSSFRSLSDLGAR